MNPIRKYTMETKFAIASLGILLTIVTINPMNLLAGGLLALNLFWINKLNLI